MSNTQHNDQAIDDLGPSPRNDARAVYGLTVAFNARRGEAGRHGADADRLRNGMTTLVDTIRRPIHKRTDGVHEALHGEGGALDEERVVKYLQLVAGEAKLTGREALQRILDTADDARAVSGFDVSLRFHALANGTLTLPAQSQPQAVTGAQEQQPVTGQQTQMALDASSDRLPMPAQGQNRPPIQPPPPMFPPAPPAGPAASTGQIIAVLREEGHEIPEEAERAARKDHGTGAPAQAEPGAGAQSAAPDMGPGPDPRFGAAALPMNRVGSTRPLPAAVPDTPESNADSDAEPDETSSEPRPFPGASTASPRSDDSSDAHSSDSGEDDARTRD